MNINIRFFAIVNVDDEIEEVEITMTSFEWLVGEGATISYERHTVYENGVRQICLTVDSIYDVEDLEVIK